MQIYVIYVIEGFPLVLSLLGSKDQKVKLLSRYFYSTVKTLDKALAKRTQFLLLKTQTAYLRSQDALEVM